MWRLPLDEANLKAEADCTTSALQKTKGRKMNDAIIILGILFALDVVALCVQHWWHGKRLSGGES